MSDFDTFKAWFDQISSNTSSITTNSTNISTNATNIQSTIDQLVQGYKSVVTTGHTPADLNTSVGASINNRITALEGGGTLTQYTSSATWTNPTPAAHNLITVICINGGQGGGKPGNVTGGGPGGLSGGYTSQQFYTDALPSTVTMTIGAGGAGATSTGNGTAGGTTSFGTTLVGTSGVGSVIKADGSYSTSVPPGNGGFGAHSNGSNIATHPDMGVSGPFAAGGSAGMGAAGGNGGAAPTGVPSGGGGGGGGGTSSSTSAFAGGAGGFPGGGGGGGGGISSGSVVGNGGAGAAGCIYVIT